MQQNVDMKHQRPYKISLIARIMGPTWAPSGADRTQVGPMLAPWTLLSEILCDKICDEKKWQPLCPGHVCAQSHWYIYYIYNFPSFQLQLTRASNIYCVLPVLFDIIKKWHKHTHIWCVLIIYDYIMEHFDIDAPTQYRFPFRIPN